MLLNKNKRSILLFCKKMKSNTKMNKDGMGVERLNREVR